MKPMMLVDTAVSPTISGSWEEGDLAVDLGREGIEAWDCCSRQASWIARRCNWQLRVQVVDGCRIRLGGMECEFVGVLRLGQMFAVRKKMGAEVTVLYDKCLEC